MARRRTRSRPKKRTAAPPQRRPTEEELASTMPGIRGARTRKLRRDPVSGKILPAWMDAAENVFDADGNPVHEEVRAGAIRAFRYPKRAKRVERLYLEVLRAVHKGRSIVDDLSEGELETLNKWLHVPEAFMDSRRIRIADILSNPSGGAPIAAWNISLQEVRRVRPLGTRGRLPHDGFYIVRDKELPHGIERYLEGMWLVTDDPDLRLVIGRKSFRKVSFLGDWRFTDDSLPDDTEACASTLLSMSREVGVRLTQTPAQYGWHIMQQYQTGRWPLLDHEACAMAMEASPGYVIGGPTQTGMVDSHIYDLNDAYATWLRWWPDLSLGHWEPVTEYEGPFGVYLHSFRSPRREPMGIVLGQPLAETVNPFMKEMQKSVIGGFAWQADRLTADDTPWEKFVAFCHVYDGPARKVVKRAPVFVVGKSRSATWDGDVYNGNSCFYPLIWSNVVAGLNCYMQDMVSRYRPHMVYIDCVHVPAALPESICGKEVGQWKLLDAGLTEYSSLGNWKSPHLPARHQGLQLEAAQRRGVMPKVSQMYPDVGQYYKAEDLSGPVSLEIQGLETDDTFGSEELILLFKGSDKKLRLNKTNALSMAEKLGDEATEWIGKTIQIVAVPVTYQGRKVKGIRVIL